MFGSNRRFSVTGSSIRSAPVGQSMNRPSVQRSRTPEISSMFGGGMLGNTGNTSVNVYASGPLASTTMLNSLVPEYEDYLRRYYHDIYYTDAVAGTCVDLMSSFPFSEYTLTGVDQAKLDKYAESLTRINVRSLMPEISTAYLVDGSSINSFLFNRDEKIFIDLILYSVDNCVIQQVPFYSQDPMIVVNNTQQMIQFMNSNDRNAKAFLRLLPQDLVHTFRQAAFKLDPYTTLYLSRRTLPGAEPTSFLKRILPIYLLEKVLYRGTIVEANKRQRSMLHVSMGDDTHTFTPEEMAETVNQFQLADLDPLGAVIGTRNDVQASELRQGGDFWKWTDTIEQLVPYKLRALGIGEAFLSQDANFSNAETSLSVFMENLDQYRSFLTYETFTNKLFPIVAIANDYFKPGKKVDTNNRSALNYQASNSSDLEIPTVHWHKELSARDEDNMMDTLSTLTEKGFPIPMRMWAAAGRVDMSAYLHDLAQDKDVRDKIAEASGLDPKKIGAAGSGMGDGMEFAQLRSLMDQASGHSPGHSLANMTGRVRPQNMLSRDFGESGEVVGQTPTGKAKYILNQKGAQAKANDQIWRAMRSLKDPNKYKAALSRAAERLGGIPDMVGVPSDHPTSRGRSTKRRSPL